MKVKGVESEFPMKILISFDKLFEKYRNDMESFSELQQDRAKKILELAEEYPVLSEGIDSPEQLAEYREQVNFVLADFFADVLGSNEIKIASIPYRYIIFRTSKRFDDITSKAGEDFQAQLNNFNQDEAYIMGCSIILNAYYGYKIDFRRPFYYNIPDAQGIMRYYRVLYNGDFVHIEKTKNSKDITDDDVAELIDNFDNIDVWKEKFPPQSWLFRGFVIANMYDATMDVSISRFKENLIKHEGEKEEFLLDFKKIIQGIFSIGSLEVGFTTYNKEELIFESPPGISGGRSYILQGKESEASKTALCDTSYEFLFKRNEPYIVSDVPKFFKLYPENELYKRLYEQEVGSAILVPLVSRGSFLGVMELVSFSPRALNTVNASKLQDILPYLVDYVRQKKERRANEIELLIQDECTAIHPSVHWKFKKEAERVIDSRNTDAPLSFREVTFEDVYPLYGQIDIKGSSLARNEATKKDLILQLKHVRKIIEKIYAIDELPIYEQINFEITRFLKQIKDNLEVDTERKVLTFLRDEIIPLYDHLSGKSDALKALIDEYYKKIDKSKGFIYKHRKDYDESVTLINKALANIIDSKQNNAQAMYPHYFERFKTDGVEHNLYIGESITKHKSFNKIYLYNLRLWQLQVMCEMENSFYQIKDALPVQVNVSSMILVFNSSLSLRFRMDEKRFDVDGTYNARYEVVKKRVDKANIKGTEERITQPGKITIVYSQRADEKEYLKYIKFLQHKQLLDSDVEIFELEDLQGVTGLMAIRVSVLYNKESGSNSEYYTYDDLMSQINNN